MNLEEAALARYEQIGDFAATIADPSAELIRFGRPEITVEAVSIEGYDVPGVTVLHVQLTVTDLDDADLQLTIGYADLLSLETFRIADYREALELLTTGTHWDDLAPWSFHGLFNPKDKDDCLFRRYPKDHLQVVTIVRDVFVDPSFRRHQFGAWMLAEIAGQPHELTTLFVGEPRAEDPYVEEDAYWKDVLKATQLNWRYQIAMAGSPGLKAAREFLSQSLPNPIYVSSAEIRLRYDAGDSTLWPRSLVMPPLRFDHREAEYRRLWDEYINQSPNRERQEEIKERLDEIREEKDEEFKDYQKRLDAKSEMPDASADEDEDSSDDMLTWADRDYPGRSVGRDGALTDGVGGEAQPVTQIRVATWNVGHRITRKPIPPAMGEALIALEADVVFLNEFVDGAPDRDRLREQLRAAGYNYFAISEAPPRHNQVFVASRFPIEVGDIDAPTEPDSHAETNFLHIRFPDSDIELIGLRAPAYKSAAERRDYWSDLTSTLQIYRNRALVVAGDLNLDPFKRVSGARDSVEFPDAEMYCAVRPEGSWSFVSLHDASKNSRIDHVLHGEKVILSDVRYYYQAGGIELAGPDSPHKGDHAVLMFTAELTSRMSP